MLGIGRQYAYSQNLIRSHTLVKRLLNKSQIFHSDIVIEIGSGTGVITKELATRCKQLIAYEIDPKLYSHLSTDITKLGNINLINSDFLKCTLPSIEYKVFSNIPFNFTSRILTKLLKSTNPPTISYLVLQEEAAQKYMGLPKETQLSLLLKPIFKFQILARLKRSDFIPRPRVKSVFVEIVKLKEPLVEVNNYNEYKDFITYSTTQWKPTIRESLSKIFTKHQMKHLSTDLGFKLDAKPLDLTQEQWLGLYKAFCSIVEINKKKLVKGFYVKQTVRQSNLQKLYRTRKK